MSIKQESTPITVAKKKAKHLYSILKVRIPDISLGECLNSYARMEGARDWNTLSAALRTHTTDESLYKKIGTFIDKTLRPTVMQLGSAYAMDVSAQGSYFVAQRDGDENVVYSRPAKEVDVTFHPKKQTNSDYSFSIEVTPTGISVERGEFVFVFPENGYSIAVSIFSSKRMPYDLTPSLLRNTHKGELIYNLILGIEPFFTSSGASKEIWDAPEEIEHIRRELDETIGKYAKLNEVFQRLSKHWGSKRLVSSFETALWEVFTGTPRYMSVSPEFYRASFGDVILTAFIDKSGPHITGAGGDVNLGACSIIYREADDKMPAGYYVAKYGSHSEPRIYLKGISKEDISKITFEFGVPPDYELAQELGIPIEEVKDEYTAFFRSRAFPGLQDWVSRNRSFAKKIRKNAPYLPDWYERATGLHPIPDSDEELNREGEAVRYPRLRK